MSQMKFVSSPETCVEDMLTGIGYLYPFLHVDPIKRIVFLNKIDDNVKILSGGGAGHEPFSAGFVGDGMLSAAVSGKVFASPPARHIYEAIMTLSANNNNNGVLVIVLNYTGDIINFGLAIQQAKANGVNVDRVVVAEDCSKFENEASKAGRRGMCGAVIVMKIAGAMSKMGHKLPEICETCSTVTKNLVSIGVCVTSCTVPGTGMLFQLPSDKMEFGVGVHGEAGTSRTNLIPIQELVEMMLKKLVQCLNLKYDQNICILINNLGSVSQLEMGIILNEINKSAKLKKLNIIRIYAGTFVTSLDMAGFQICLLNVTNNNEWLAYLDYESKAPGWSNSANITPNQSQKLQIPKIDDNIKKIKEGKVLNEKEAKILKSCLEAAASIIKTNKAHLNELDSKAGDGDTGTTINYLAEGILEGIDEFVVQYPAICFSQLTTLAEIKMGGTLGGILSIIFTSISAYFSKETKNGHWLGAYEQALTTLMEYTLAKIGDRTMLDVLIPVYNAYNIAYKENNDHYKAFKLAASISRQEAERTRQMIPKAGRASYVAQNLITEEDPGAYAAALCLEVICKTIQQQY